MIKDISIIDTNIDNISKYGFCGYKNPKKEGFPEKFEWLKIRYSEGLKIKVLYSEKDGTQGMIEYIPGKYCWRPVDASGYMFIHCIFVGFRKIHKNKGYASMLLKECEKDAKAKGLNGVAVVTRKGSFMADKEIFIKNGFELVDSTKPDFELLVKKININIPSPKFRNIEGNDLTKYGKGLTIIRADQCPYTVKNVREIVETARKDYNIETTVLNLNNHKEAQNSPCAFGTFCIIFNGDIVANHPISKGRFVNIINKK